MSAARSRAAALIVGTGIPVAWLEAARISTSRVGWVTLVPGTVRSTGKDWGWENAGMGLVILIILLLLLFGGGGYGYSRYGYGGGIGIGGILLIVLIVYLLFGYSRF